VARRVLAAIALCVPMFAGAAEIALGTLFHTPEERERLDRMRRGEPEKPQSSAPNGVPSVTGFVKRSDGRHTVWIDGTPISVRGGQNAPVFDPRAVRAYSDREEDALKIDRKPAP
jgi:hypothetical protein